MRQRGAREEKDLRGKNAYEQRRIDYSKNVGTYVERAKTRFLKLTPPDELLKDKDEVRAQAEQRDLDDRKAAKKALDDLLASKGLGSAEALRKAQRGGDAPADAELRDKFRTEQEKAAGEAEKDRQPGGPQL